MLHGYTMATVPCGNPTPKKLPTGDGEWPTFRTARAQRTVRPPMLASPPPPTPTPHTKQPPRPDSRGDGTAGRGQGQREKVSKPEMGLKEVHRVMHNNNSRLLHHNCKRGLWNCLFRFSITDCGPHDYP